MLLDLSHPILDRMPVYPGDPPVSIRLALEIAANGVAVAGLQLGSHTGTHVDAPAHTVPGGRTMADVSLDELVGEAVVLRVDGAEGGRTYGWRDLDPHGRLPPHLPPIAMIDTGWARWFTDDARREHHPALDPSAAQELLARGVHVLAVDTLSPDPTGGDGFPVHDLVLGADHLIVENIRGLELMPDRARVGFFPLKIGDDGAPVRAVAFLSSQGSG